MTFWGGHGAQEGRRKQPEFCWKTRFSLQGQGKNRMVSTPQDPPTDLTSLFLSPSLYLAGHGNEWRNALWIRTWWYQGGHSILCFKTIQLSKYEDLIGFIQQCVVWAASHLAERRERRRAAEKDRILEVERGWDKQVISKRQDYFRQGHLPLRDERESTRWVTSQVLHKKCQIDWLKVIFLRALKLQLG